MELREPIYYNVSELASFFHSFPHYDLKFTPVSPSFNPEYQPYQEVCFNCLTVYVTRYVIMGLVS